MDWLWIVYACGFSFTFGFFFGMGAWNTHGILPAVIACIIWPAGWAYVAISVAIDRHATE